MTSVQLVNPVGSGARTVQTGEGSYRRLRAGGCTAGLPGGLFLLFENSKAVADFDTKAVSKIDQNWWILTRRREAAALCARLPRFRFRKRPRESCFFLGALLPRGRVKAAPAGTYFLPVLRSGSFFATT